MIRLLHVDDNSDHLEIIKLHLLKLARDLHFEWAMSASEALELLGKESFHCILCDYQLPDTDGIQLLKSLRDGGDSTPCIFLTGQGNEEVAAQAFRAGADDYYTKETGFAHYERLLNSIRRVVAAHQQRVNHREAEEALRLSESRYRSLFENSKEAVYITTVGGDLIDINQSGSELLGYSREELQSMNVRSLYADPADRNGFIRYSENRDYVKDYPVDLRRKDGEIIRVLITATVQKDREGNVVGFQGILRDAGGHDGADEALEESEARYRNLVERANDGIALIQDGLLIYANPSVAKLLGYSAADAGRLTGKRFEDLLHPSEAPKLEELYRRRVAGEDVPSIYETIVMHRDGSEISVEVNVEMITYKGRPAVLAIIRDITERKRAEESIRKSEERYRTFIEQSSEGIWRFEFEQPLPLDLPEEEQIEHAYTYAYLAECNDEMARMYGYSQASEIIGARLGDLLDPSIPENLAYFRALAESGFRLTNAESHEKDKDGNRKVFLNNIVGIVEEGKLLRLWGTQRDITAQKLMEEELKESRNKYLMLIEKLLEGVLLEDAEGIITLVNPRTLQMLGYSEEEIVGKHWSMIVPREEIERIRVELKKRPLGLSSTYESVLRMKGGEKIPVIVSANPIIDEEGEFQGILSVFTDITEQKRSEEELRKHVAAIETSIDGMAILDEHELYIYLNEAHARVYGYDNPDELLGKTWRELYSEEWVERFEKEIMPALYAHGHWRGDAIGKRRDGSFFDQELSLSVLETGGIVCVVRDITERKRAEQELQRSEQMYKTLVNTSPDSVIMADLDGCITYASEQTLELHGYEHAEELLGKNALELIVGEDREQARKDLKRTLEEGVVRNVEYTFLRKDGSGFIGELNCALVRDVSGGPKAFIATVRDISERKRAEEELKRHRDQLQESTSRLKAAYKELESFSYSVSHDLRAPLLSIESFSRMLLDEYGDSLDERAKDYIQHIASAAERMNQLVKDLLKLSQMTSRQVNRRKVDLSVMARLILFELRATQPERQIDIVVADDVVANGDESLLRMILENLLGNAWKFTAEIDKARIEFGVDEQEGRPVYFVRDNGIGFDMSLSDKLFLPFQRLHNADYGGSGIGLAIVQRVVLLHGGKVWAEGKVGKGATFFFTIG